MKECWANEHSACNGKISREHYISKGIFEQQFIYVSGFKWCKGEQKKISIANLTSKILCKYHNNQLSVVDKAGINAIRIFEQCIPEQYRSVKTVPEFSVIDGINFERWLLKIAINLTFKGDKHIGVGMTNSIPGIPSPYLLQVVFGGMPFTHKMGLYFLHHETARYCNAGEFSMTPIYQNSAIGGFIFHIRGFDFFLSLYPGHVPPKLNTLGIGGDIGNAVPIYRSELITSFDQNKNSFDAAFKWKSQPERK
jgi:hypothetical protein